MIRDAILLMDIHIIHAYYSNRRDTGSLATFVLCLVLPPNQSTPTMKGE